MHPNNWWAGISNCFNPVHAQAFLSFVSNRSFAGTYFMTIDNNVRSAGFCLIHRAFHQWQRGLASSKYLWSATLPDSSPPRAQALILRRRLQWGLITNFLLKKSFEGNSSCRSSLLISSTATSPNFSDRLLLPLLFPSYCSVNPLI